MLQDLAAAAAAAAPAAQLSVRLARLVAAAVPAALAGQGCLQILGWGGRLLGLASLASCLLLLLLLLPGQCFQRFLVGVQPG
jgi:hypothetical protein